MIKPQIQIHLFFLLLLAGCAAPSKKGTETVPQPVQLPGTAIIPKLLEKTFGEATRLGGAAQVIRYKTMAMVVDPSGADGLETADYLLLTDIAPDHFSSSAKAAARKDLKIIAPPDAVANLNRDGFINVKGLEPGQKIMLKKDGAFLFASAIQAKNSTGGGLVNGYLLEFENGRNLLITGGISDMEALRPFLYSLRDDGKEVHLMFLSVASMTEAAAAEVVGLFQPNVAVLIPGTALSAQKFNEPLFRQTLIDQLFEGTAVFSHPNDTFPF